MNFVKHTHPIILTTEPTLQLYRFTSYGPIHLGLLVSASLEFYLTFGRLHDEFVYCFSAFLSNIITDFVPSNSTLYGVMQLSGWTSKLPFFEQTTKLQENNFQYFCKSFQGIYDEAPVTTASLPWHVHMHDYSCTGGEWFQRYNPLITSKPKSKSESESESESEPKSE